MGDHNKLRLVKLKDPKVLQPVLEERHPQSCFVLNQVIFSAGLKDDLTFYTLGKEINSETWVLIDYFREDEGHEFSISAPSAIVSRKEQITPEIEECFSSGGIIDWDDNVVFVALEKPVSAMIFDISANIKGNVTEVHPCVLYYMEKAEALKLPLSWGPEAEVRRLQSDDAEFITSTWKYSKENSDVVYRKCIEAIASAGVFADGKCVSGVATVGCGLICSLYTLREYRNRGYGKVTMHYTYKECAKDGLTPCSTVEVRNERSLIFHDKIGAKSLGVVDWIDVKKLNID